MVQSRAPNDALADLGPPMKTKTVHKQSFPFQLQVESFPKLRGFIFEIMIQTLESFHMTGPNSAQGKKRSRAAFLCERSLEPAMSL